MEQKTNWDKNPNNLAVFGALCLFLSAIEYMIPKPLPFMRIGIANLPLMLALDIFPFPSFIILVFLKVFGQAIITGTLFSYVFLFSVAGTFCSALLMFALRRVFKQRISFIGIGAAGAMISNTAQIALAYFFVFKESARYIAPWFLGTGLVTGVVLGIFVEVFVRKPRWFSIQGSGSVVSNLSLIKHDMLSNNKPTPEPRSPNPYVKFCIGLAIMLLIVFIPSTELRVITFLILWLLAIIFRKKTNPVFTILFIITIVAFNLLIPHGKVLYSIGFFKITSGALSAGIHRAFTFQALVMLSKLTISEDLRLPGKFGNLLGESLRLFSIMMNNKISFKGKNITEIIDELLAI